MFKRFLKPNYIIATILAVILIILGITSRPPADFPSGIDISLEKNTSLSALSKNLEEKKIISSELLFKVAVVILGGQKGVKAGDYRFSRPQDIWVVALRFVKGDHGQNRVTVTIPEGTNVKDMAEILEDKLPKFNASSFISIASQYEGHLFPDTYFFFENTSPEGVVETMLSRFEQKVDTVKARINSFGKPFEDIITMASIVEKETYPDESRRVVAGILWKRLEEGMPLQVDAPFYYITGKKGNFSSEDLKIDSPYNTYLYKGLPKGPISNPSLSAILDTVTPLETPYWFYLTDEDGEMRYAETYDGHLANIDRYLR